MFPCLHDTYVFATQPSVGLPLLAWQERRHVSDYGRREWRLTVMANQCSVDSVLPINKAIRSRSSAAVNAPRS